MKPTDLIKTSEHSHQRALFCWANMAARFGLIAANTDAAYEQAGVAQGMLQQYNDRIIELDFLFAIHNQGHGDKVHGAQAKAEGVKAGVPDVMLPVPRPITMNQGIKVYYHGLFIELKIPEHKNHKNFGASDEQVRWLSYLDGQGYRCVVACGYDKARFAILDYLGLLLEPHEIKQKAYEERRALYCAANGLNNTRMTKNM